MAKPLQNYSKSQYQRPNKKWSCGNDELEFGCPQGPSAEGSCDTHALCEPVEQGGKFKCARTKIQGGKCKAGPAADGSCGLQVERCYPQLDLRVHRGRFVFVCFSLALAIGALLLSGSRKQEFFAPGPLTDSHALITGKANGENRCATCHDAGERGFASWMKAAIVGHGANHVPQSSKCLDCHGDMILPEHAHFAHTMNSVDLEQVSEAQLQRAFGDARTRSGHRHTGEADGRACSACHQEHHGALHDLNHMSDQQCNICHQNQFASFADGHPEFSEWPTNRRGRIIFDHNSHGGKYFREAKREFKCVSCHALEGREPLKIVGFEENCASCHAEDIATSTEKSLAMLRLPTIDRRAMEREGLSVGEWPAALQGDFDGPIPPPMYLLLWADPVVRPALEQFEGACDFFDVDADNFDDLEAASEIVWGIKRLLNELRLQGETAIRRRAARVVAMSTGSFDKEQLEGLTAGYNPTTVKAMLALFPNLARESRSEKAPSPHASRSVSSKTARWIPSADRSEVNIRVKGHSNDLMRAWIEVATALGGEAPLRLPDLVGATAVGACTSCHSLEYRDERLATLTVNWYAKPDSQQARRLTERKRSFTRFQHEPHLLQGKLSDCVACHRLDSTAEYLASFTSLDPAEGCSGFQHLGKATCADCHTKEGAGDACLKCHQYHTGEGMEGFVPMVSSDEDRVARISGSAEER